jgi:hypothetical protein
MVKAEKKACDFEILLSTMHRTTLSFLAEMFPDDDFLNYHILIINQTTKDKLLTSQYPNIRVINTFETGLSKSRNLAIRNAKGHICLIADDDVKYKLGFKDLILDAYKEFSNADIVTFQMIDDSGRLYNNYPDVLKHNKKSVHTVNSVVIAFKTYSLKLNNISYNEHFGLGSKFQTADEYVFLRNALKKRLNIFFQPKVILSHKYHSSGKEVGSDRVLFALGGLFYKYSGILSYLRMWKYLFLIHQSKDIMLNEVLYKYGMGLKGINEYRRLLKQGLETRK